MNQQRNFPITSIVGIVCGLVLSALFVETYPLLAQEQPWALKDAIQQQGHGTINWTSGTISARGFGLASSAVPSGAAFTMAERAAIAVARRNLLELIVGIRIDSETIVENYLVKSDVITSRVQGLIKNAVVQEKSPLLDGGVEVILALNIWGANSLVASVVPENTPASASNQSDESSGPFTGIIFDTRGLDIQPAAFPSVTDVTGEVIYSQNMISPALLHEASFIQYYVNNPDNQAKFFSEYLLPVEEQPQIPVPRVGRRPLHIKGLEKSGSLQTDILISREDAQKIRNDPALYNLLKKAKAIIVIDPLVAGVEGHLSPRPIIPAAM